LKSGIIPEETSRQQPPNPRCPPTIAGQTKPTPRTKLPQQHTHAKEISGLSALSCKPKRADGQQKMPLEPPINTRKVTHRRKPGQEPKSLPQPRRKNYGLSPEKGC
jgi:hypothetical protein